MNDFWGLLAGLCIGFLVGVMCVAQLDSFALVKEYDGKLYVNHKDAIYLMIPASVEVTR